MARLSFPPNPDIPITPPFVSPHSHYSPSSHSQRSRPNLTPSISFFLSSSSLCSRLLSISGAHVVFVCVVLIPVSTRVSSGNGYFPWLSSEMQRILDRMDDSETYINVQIVKPDSGSPSTSHQTSIYKKLNIWKDDSEDPPIASGPGELRVTTQSAAHGQQSKVKFGNRPYRLICLLCLVTSALIVIVVGLSIHVSQIRHKFTEMGSKYRSVNEANAQICELLTSRRAQTCSEDWVTNNDRCYYASKFETSFRKAMQECSNRDSRLLEINSRDEAVFVSHKLLYRNRAHWIGKCEAGTVGLALLYNASPGTSDCRYCEPHVGSNPCDTDRRFICEKSAPMFPDITEMIQGLC